MDCDWWWWWWLHWLCRILVELARSTGSRTAASYDRRPPAPTDR